MSCSPSPCVTTSVSSPCPCPDVPRSVPDAGPPGGPHCPRLLLDGHQRGRGPGPGGGEKPDYQRTKNWCVTIATYEAKTIHIAEFPMQHKKNLSNTSIFCCYFFIIIASILSSQIKKKKIEHQCFEMKSLID